MRKGAKLYNEGMRRENEQRNEYIVVLCTTGSAEEAQRIARRVVEQRLAACAQVMGPIKSTYWWEGKIEESGEWLCLMKTRGELFEGLRRAIREVHSYQTPEIVAIDIVAGDAEYLRWMDGEVGGARSLAG